MAVNPKLTTELLAAGTPPGSTAYSLSAQQVANALVNHIESDIDPFAVVTNPADSQQIIGGRLRLSQLAIPVPAITPVGGAAGSQSYIVVAKCGLSNLQPSATVSTSAGPTTLSVSTYNTVAWPAITGATQYDVYRSAGGTTQGLIAANVTVLTLNDTGLTGDTTTAPAATATFAAAATRDINAVALATPPLAAVAVVGTAGGTTCTYTITADDYVGTAPASVTTTTANATQTTSNYNALTWNYVPGATQYRIFRTAGGASQGLIATVAQAEQASFTLNDTALASTTATTPSVNTTGAGQFAGPVFSAGLHLAIGTSANATATTTTLTVANMLCSVLLRSGGTTPTDTTPTAAAIVGGLAGAKVGMSWKWTIRNANSGTETLAAGSGVTLAAGNTNTTATVTAHEYLIVLTNVTAGSEAVTIYSLGVGSAY